MSAGDEIPEPPVVDLADILASARVRPGHQDVQDEWDEYLDRLLDPHRGARLVRIPGRDRPVYLTEGQMQQLRDRMAARPLSRHRIIF